MWLHFWQDQRPRINISTVLKNIHLQKADSPLRQDQSLISSVTKLSSDNRIWNSTDEDTLFSQDQRTRIPVFYFLKCDFISGRTRGPGSKFVQFWKNEQMVSRLNFETGPEDQGSISSVTTATSDSKLHSNMTLLSDRTRGPGFPFF